MTSLLFLIGKRTKIFCGVIKVWYITMVYEDQQKHQALVWVLSFDTALICLSCLLPGSRMNIYHFIWKVLADPNLHFTGKRNVHCCKIIGHMGECSEISILELGHKLKIHFHKLYFGFWENLFHSAGLKLESQMWLYCHLSAVLYIAAPILGFKSNSAGLVMYKIRCKTSDCH